MGFGSNLRSDRDRSDDYFTAWTYPVHPLGVSRGPGTPLGRSGSSGLLDTWYEGRRTKDICHRNHVVEETVPTSR